MRWLVTSKWNVSWVVEAKLLCSASVIVLCSCLVTRINYWTERTVIVSSSTFCSAGSKVSSLICVGRRHQDWDVWLSVYSFTHSITAATCPVARMFSVWWRRTPIELDIFWHRSLQFIAMLKWAVTSRGSPTSTSGLSGTRPGGEIENYMSASRAGAWPTYNDVSVAEPSEMRWSPQWMMEDSDDDDRDSLSAYNDNTSTLEQMMTIDFNDDSQVLFKLQNIVNSARRRCYFCQANKFIYSLTHSFIHSYFF